ncbi:peptidoglycan-binding protein [Patescibacteria group bacterium]|nr:peptidoglycan-binding protein [Patescibacteria group bacterium]
MNIFSVEGGSVGRLVTGLSLLALIMSAFPVSFATAEGEEVAPVTDTSVVSSLVEETEPGDLCDNMLGVQLEVPTGWMADGSSCYLVEPSEPTLETIEVCKYTYGEGESYIPVAGWIMFVTNIDPNEIIAAGPDDVPEGYIYEVVTDDTGCVTQSVNSENGPWYVFEDIEDGWYQSDVDVVGGYATESEGDNFCVFFDDEIISSELSRSGEYSYSCDFYNVDDREEVTGYKWNDENNNGVKDDSEVGVQGWTITASDNTKAGYSPVSAVTDANGYYSMMLPSDGNWVITEELRSGWTQTAVYENGYKLTEETEEGGSIAECSLNLRSKYTKVAVLDEVTAPELYNRCDFLNYQEPRRSGGSSSGTRVRERATPQSLVLGAATGTPACGMYLQDYMRMGNAASTTQVTKLQVFLNAVGITAPLTGIFDAGTDAAVRAFQMQYKPEVLTPWYLAKLVPHENSTGWVYQLTRWKINNIVCPGSEAYPVLN